MKKIFCCPALELFHCLPLWKTVLFVSSRAFSLSTPTFLLSTPVENSEATWKKATKCNKGPNSTFQLTHIDAMDFTDTEMLFGSKNAHFTVLPGEGNWLTVNREIQTLL